MDGFDRLGGGVLLAVVAVLWLIYLVPAWMQRRKYTATERQVTRMQQALRVMTETSGEGSNLVDVELTARKVAIVAREARRQKRLALAAERDRAKAATRERIRVERIRSEQEKEVARMSADVESVLLRVQGRADRATLRNTVEYRAAALRRGRLLSSSIVALGLICVLVGAIVAAFALAGWWVLAFGVVAVLGGFSLLNAAARTARAYRARGFVSARDVAVPGVRVARPVNDASAEVDVAVPDSVSAEGAVAEKPAERVWTPQSLPAPLTVTREQILAAARAEAAAAESGAVLGIAEGLDTDAAVDPGVGVVAGAVVDVTVTAAARAGAESADSRDELRRASEEAVAALRAAEHDPAVAPIESARSDADGFGWLVDLEADTAAAAADSASRLDDVLQRRRNVG